MQEYFEMFLFILISLFQGFKKIEEKYLEVQV